MFEKIRAEFRRHESEVLNPALWAVLNYRFGKWASGLKFYPFNLLCSLIYGVNNRLILLTGNIRIYRRTKIGKNLRLVHSGNILISPDAVIGDNCVIQHNVTIGGYLDKEGAPKIGNDVYIGTGAVIIGDISVGNGAKIAANSLVISDVPEGVTAIGVPARVMKYTGRTEEKN